jgi:protein tyrosine phosphatase (PTP) superfamily phosphohydrolase (DUF442 family)
MVNKLIKYGLLVVGLILSLAGGQGKELPSPKITIPLWSLLLDTEDFEALPRRLRTSKDTLPETFEASGLADLNISGSAQFSALQFKALVGHLRNFGFSQDEILVVDLREEPHGFVNGNAFTWYAKQAWWVQNDPVAFVVENEKQRLAALSIGQSVLLKYIAHKGEAGDVQRLTDHSYVIASLMSEEQVVREAGAQYVRLPVTDHMRPDDKDVEQFLSLVKKLPSHTWIHFHCRAGRGRTSTFMIMYDMVRNLHLSKKAIIDRQVQLGSVDIRRLSGPLKAHKHSNEKLRSDFVDLFYEYVHAPDGYGNNSWTKWNMQRYMKFLKSEYKEPLS